MRRVGLLAVAAAAILVTGLQITPARADADDWGGWRRHEWREHQWREQAWRRHEWREHHRWYPGYYRYGYYYTAPAYYYAPPTYYYYTPGVSVGFSFP